MSGGDFTRVILLGRVITLFLIITTVVATCRRRQKYNILGRGGGVRVFRPGPYIHISLKWGAPGRNVVNTTVLQSS